MKFNFTKEWCVKKALEENCTNINAGAYYIPNSEDSESISCHRGASTLSRTAFGKLIQFLRRKGEMSRVDLATSIDMEIEELINIEDNAECTPEPRSIYVLAKFFKLDIKKLSQLAGLTVLRDSTIERNAQAFAASSENISKLSREELEALETFVAVLSEKP